MLYIYLYFSPILKIIINCDGEPEYPMSEQIKTCSVPAGLSTMMFCLKFGKFSLLISKYFTRREGLYEFSFKRAISQNPSAPSIVSAKTFNL